MNGFEQEVKSRIIGTNAHVILLRYGNAGFGGQSEMKIVGEEASDRFTVTDDPIVGTVTLWPSDHAGVLATFWPAPGLRKMW